jgi:hypothetical protein
MQQSYVSSRPYESERIYAAAVYCSDGRLGDHIDEFLHKGLGLPRYDRLACPGGPAALAGRLAASWESRSIEEHLRFLVRVHEIKRVVLLAHRGCAYYAEYLRIPGARIEAEQLQDLQKAFRMMQQLLPGVHVERYMAHVIGAEVHFHALGAT